MNIAPDITVPDAEVAELCRKYQVRELSVFGSAARGEMGPDSDVDLLVDFEPEARPGLLEVSAMIREFSDLLGRRADIAIKRALKPRVRPEVLADARVLYAA
jgi:uncharacterized protein